jgi:hypothetical protein
MGINTGRRVHRRHDRQEARKEKGDRLDGVVYCCPVSAIVKIEDETLGSRCRLHESAVMIGYDLMKDSKIQCGYWGQNAATIL